MANAKGGVKESRDLLKGERFYVCKANCGPMKAQILRANIHSHGGKVLDSIDSNVAFVLFDKSCEDNSEKMSAVRSEFSGEKQGAQLVSSRWLEEVIEKKEWKDPVAVSCTVSASPSHKRDLSAMDTDTPRDKDESGKKMKSSSSCSPETHPYAPEENEATGPLPLPAVPKYLPNTSRPPPPHTGDFRTVLQRIVANPEKNKDITLLRTKTAVVIYDAYPKAKFHVLVMPTKDIMSVSAGTRDHLPVLRELHRVGLHVVEALRVQGAEGFRMGYHRVPSLNHLHLHVISVDFDSACLKNKKHWNSFQPPFFVDSLELQEEVDRTGGFAVDAKEAEELLKAPLRCHRSDGRECKTVPALKEHIKSCTSPVASGTVY